MAKQVENRVVEMEFKNKDFEKAVSVTMKSLEELNKKLDDLNNVNVSGFERVTENLNNTNFNRLIENIDYLRNRFGFLGEVVHDIWGDLIDGAEAAMAKVEAAITRPLDIIEEKGKARATNLAQAKFQLTNLGVSWGEIKEDIDYAVNDTRFGLDEAAMAASQLSASGIKVGDDMKKALLGISGVAAMTNSEFSEIAHIFTTIAGTGKVYTQQLNMIAARGLNATAALAKYMGISEQQVRDIISDKEQFIDFATFAEAMWDQYGESAKKGNDLFSGALSNAKAALGRIGEKFYTPFYEYARQVLVAVKPVINDINSALDPMFKKLDLGMSKVKDLFVFVLDTIHKSLDPNNEEPVILSLFGNPVDMKSTIGGFIAWITEALSGFVNLFTGGGMTSIVGETLLNIFYNIYEVAGIIKDAFTDVFGTIEGSDILFIADKIRDFTDDMKISEERAENLKRSLAGLLAVIDMLWKTVSALFKVFIEPMLISLGILEDGIFDITGDVGDMLVAFDNIYDPFGPLYDAVHRVGLIFAPITMSIKKFVTTIGDTLSGLTGITDVESFFTKLEEVVTKLHIADAFYMIGGAIVYCIQQLGIFLQMFNDSSSFKEYIHSLAEQSKVLSWIQEKYTKLKTTLNDLFSGKITLVQALGLDKLAEKFTWLTPIIDKFKEHYKSIFEAFEGREGREGLPFITLFGDKLKEAIKNLQWEDIYGAIGAGFYAYWIKKSVEIKSAVAESFNNFVGVFKTFTEGINMSLVKLQKETNAEKILKIAASVALLAGSVYLLAGISSDDILKAVGAVAALMFILTVFIGFLGKFTQSTKELSEKSESLMDPGGKKTTKTKGKGKNAVTTIVENLEATLTETKTTVIEKIKNFGELPALILSLAAMIGIIALAIGHLANVAHADPDAFYDAVSVTFLILGAVSAIAALFVAMSNSSMMVNPAVLSSISKLFLAMGILFNLMVVPIAALTGLLSVFYNGEVFVATSLLLLILAAFLAVILAFSMFVNVANAGAIMAAGGAMVLMAAAIALMTIPLVAIASIAKLGTLEDAFWTIEKLIFEMGGFVAIFAILGQTVTGSVGMLAGGASMILMAAAINSLIIPLAAITALVAASGNTQSFEKAKTTIMQLMGLMALIAAVFGGMTGGFGVAGAAGVIAVAGMVAGATAMILIAKAIQALIIPLAAFMALQKAGSIDQAFMDMAKGIAMLAVTAVVITLISPALGILIGLLQGLAIAALAVGTGIRNAGQGILFLVSALALLQTINFETLETKIVEAVGAMIRGFKTAISAGKPQISEGFLDLLGAGLAAFVGSTGMIAEACIKLLLDVIVVIDSHAQEIGFHLGHALTDILFYALLGVVGSASDLLIRAFGGKGEFSKQLMEDLFPKKESEGGLVDSIKGIFGGNKAKEAAEEATAETGEAASQSFANNFNIPETEIQNKLDSTFENFDVTKIAGLKGQEGGDSLLSGLSESLEIKDGQSFAAANQATMFDEGFLNGSKFNLDDYRDFGKARMSAAFEGMQEEADSHSPSRRAMELAGYIDEGFAIGLENSHAAEDAAQKEMSGIFSVISSASDVANKSFDGSALDNIRESILGITNSANADDLNPTITPVLDMSNVQSGFASLDSMFNRDRSISLAGEVNGMNAANKALSFEIQNGKSDVFNNGFSTLGTKFDRFSEAMMNRQIVLDSGELVGGLVNPMDRSLGVRAIRAQRGGGRR